MLINDLKTETIRIPLGGSLSYEYIRHPSVGLGVRVTMTPENILEITKHKERDIGANPDSNGGDKIAGVYHFKGVQKGEVTLLVQKTFRGKIRTEHSYKIEVS